MVRKITYTYINIFKNPYRIYHYHLSIFYKQTNQIKYLSHFKGSSVTTLQMKLG